MKEVVKRVVCVVLTFGILLMSGCAGRQAYPVQISQNGDYNKSCDNLRRDLTDLQYQVRQKSGQTSSGDSKDTVLLATGVLLFWPALFFMDLSNADRVELEAMQSRYNHLTNIYNSKNCQ